MDDLLSSLNTPNSSATSSLNLINQATNPSKAETSQQKLSDDLDNFLLLLTTQLQNQDPSEPLDVNDFTNQLVQFSGVEQQIATNQNLESLIAMQGGAALTNAVNYVGQFVDAKGNAGQLSGGFANFAYDVPAGATKVTIAITDGAGRVVYSGEGPRELGKNRVVWDGSNTFNSGTEPDGTYFINVLAENSKGNRLTTTTYTTGAVTGAEMRNGEVILSVAGTDVKINDVIAIRQPLQLPGGGATDPDGDDTADNNNNVVDDIADAVSDAADAIL